MDELNAAESAERKALLAPAEELIGGGDEGIAQAEAYFDEFQVQVESNKLKFLTTSLSQQTTIMQTNTEILKTRQSIQRNMLTFEQIFTKHEEQLQKEKAAQDQRSVMMNEEEKRLAAEANSGFDNDAWFDSHLATL